MQTDLPIGEVLAELSDCLDACHECVLEAPPGAGKTTIVPLALLAASWLGKRKIIMLEPRRMAARAAAERMAWLLGEQAGQTVGYRVRLDSKISAQTRIEVITEGILTRMLQSDPTLQGVGLLIFDEFHERSLDSDLGLALTLQARELFREADNPLKLLVMSATLDGAAVARVLGDAPVITSLGKQYPVAVHYGKPWQSRQNIVEPVIATLRQVLAEPETGSVLVFLPGQGEIHRVASALRALITGPSEGGYVKDALITGPSEGGFVVAPLYGGLSLDEQRQAIAPAPAGQRKIVLATNIAETSLTIEGITTVVDSGLAREPAYDPGTGMTRLQTRRISGDNATQRMGRAGRLGPGHCYRLWSEEQQRQLAPRATPEILQADLTPLVLQLLVWGVDDPAQLRWLDLPPPGPWAQALELLSEFGAIERNANGGWCISTQGELMASLPMHPRLGHMLVCGARWGVLDSACLLAAQLSDRGGRVQQQAKQFRRLCASLPRAEPTVVSEGVLLAMAYPDRIAKRRQAQGNVYQLSNGRSAVLDESSALCNQQWLVVAELGGHVGQVEDKIYHALPLEAAAFDDQLAHLVQSHELAHWDEKAERFVAERISRVGALVLARRKLDNVAAATRISALLALVRGRGLEVLAWTPELRQWQARVSLLQRELGEPWPDVSNAALLASLDVWLAPHLDAVTTLGGFRKLDLHTMLQALLPWPLPRELDDLAPQRMTVPSGSQLAIDYQQSPPVLAVKLQEMFGCETTPTIARGKVALMLHLLSPARRPLQVTQDLGSFWRGSYEQVKKEMKGRYPKHPWPDDPLQALATAKTKRRLQTD